MTKPIELLPNCYAFKVPKNAEDIKIDSSGYLTMSFPDYPFKSLYPDEWEPGNWSLIGVGISKEVAGKIVPKFNNHVSKIAELCPYFDYTKPASNTVADCYFKTAIESLISLLKSKGLNEEDNFVFLTLNK